MDTKRLMDAKAKRDVVRDQLVQALKGYTLPPELVALLEADQAATAEFHTEWMQYQVTKAQQEAMQ
jgi:hypothetical protein